MRVAALYDVHGNAHALDAVLADCGGVDVVLFGGDLAAGPFPRETVELARAVPNARFVRGNADERSNMPDVTAAWMARQLDAEQLAWLAELPWSQTLDDTLYVHANPIDYGIVTQWTSDDELEPYLPHIDTPRIVTGHVHMQWQREVGGVSWVCAGSVGMPYEPEPGAYWATVDGGDVTFRCTDFDRERAAAAIRASGYPVEGFAEENVLAVPSHDEAKAFFAP